MTTLHDRNRKGQGMTRGIFWLSCCVAICGVACSSDSKKVLHPDAEPLNGAQECEVTIESFSVEQSAHVGTCSELVFDPYPPVGGNHYSQPAAFLAYDRNIPWGFAIHSMEHGAVVLVHNCTAEGCPDLAADLRGIKDNYPEDEACFGEYYGDAEDVKEPRNRIVVMPDPTLPVPVAALAWGKSYLATCYDPESLLDFIEDNYDQATESSCWGAVDLTGIGWCDPPAAM